MKDRQSFCDLKQNMC